MKTEKHTCECRCPHGRCDHNWSEHTAMGVCRECGMSWREHQEQVLDEMQFENLRKYW